jgi:hypothetical protein
MYFRGIINENASRSTDEPREQKMAVRTRRGAVAKLAKGLRRRTQRKKSATKFGSHFDFDFNIRFVVSQSTARAHEPRATLWGRLVDWLLLRGS